MPRMPSWYNPLTRQAIISSCRCKKSWASDRPTTTRPWAGDQHHRGCNRIRGMGQSAGGLNGGQGHNWRKATADLGAQQHLCHLLRHVLQCTGSLSPHIHNLGVTFQTNQRLHPNLYRKLRRQDAFGVSWSHDSRHGVQISGSNDSCQQLLYGQHSSYALWRGTKQPKNCGTFGLGNRAALDADQRYTCISDDCGKWRICKS